MKSIFLLLLLFLVIGLFSRKFNTLTRLLLSAVIAGMILYVTLA